MADGQPGQGGQQYNSNDFYLKQQAARMLSAIQKGYNDNFTSQGSMSSPQAGSQQSMYMNHQVPQQQQVLQHPQQGQSPGPSQHMPVQHQQLQQQLQQVQQAQQQFQQMHQLAQMQQQFQNYGGSSSSTPNPVMPPQGYTPSRRGRKPTDKKKRRRHTWVKRPTTAYLYFVSKYRETLKEAGEVVPKAKIITQACAEKWRNMNEDEKEPFLELSRRDRERWQKDKALEKKPRDPNRPKRPPSAYFLFLADFRKSYPGKTDPAKEITKKAGEAWNSLSEQEKAPYYSAAQVVRAKWEKDVEIYKKNTSASLNDKNGPLSRSSSIESDPVHLEMGSDGSPVAPSPQEGLSEMNVGMMQSSSGIGLMGVSGGHNMGGNGGGQSSVLANAGPSSRSGGSYGYHHIPGGQPADMPIE